MSLLEKYIDNAVLTCLKVILDPKCKAEEELKGLVGKFIANLCQNQNIRVAITGIINKTSEGERQILQKYIA